jgi:Domain of unknown function (DUF4279)
MAAINRAVAALRIVGEELNPSEITRMLGAEPTYSHSKGDVLIRPRGRIAKLGMWRLEALPLEPSDFNAQVASLLDPLTQDLCAWGELSSKYSISLFCGWFMGESNEGEDLSPKTLMALGSRGISLALDIYAPDAE